MMPLPPDFEEEKCISVTLISVVGSNESEVTLVSVDCENCAFTIWKVLTIAEVNAFGFQICFNRKNY